MKNLINRNIVLPKIQISRLIGNHYVYSPKFSASKISITNSKLTQDDSLDISFEKFINSNSTTNIPLSIFAKNNKAKNE